MSTSNVRINVNGRISGHAAGKLGGWVEQTDEGPVLVAAYIDQAQLTGLLVQLFDLHVGFHHVAIETNDGIQPTVPTTEGVIQ